LITIVALCLPALFLPVLERVRTLFTTEVTRTAFVCLILVIVAQFSAYENFWRTTFRYYYQNSDPAVVRFGPEIGEVVGHATDVIVLGEGDGRPVTYHGKFTGPFWPYTLGGDLGSALGHGQADIPAQLKSVEGDHPATYFVVADLGLYGTQTDLRAFLETRHIAAQGPQYIVYDLTKPAP
jgi:hypothetical protein